MLNCLFINYEYIYLCVYLFFHIEHVVYLLSCTTSLIAYIRSSSLREQRVHAT